MRDFSEDANTRGDRHANQENSQRKQDDNKRKPRCIPEQGRHCADGYAVSHRFAEAHLVLSNRGKEHEG